MKTRKSFTFRALVIALTFLMLVNIAAFGWNIRPFLEQRGVILPFYPTVEQAPIENVQATLEQTVTNTPADPTITIEPISLADSTSQVKELLSQGIMILSMRDGRNIHLFGYHPLYLPLQRLTDQTWDDITPSLSPDGTKIAFSSNETGYWDLYIFDLVSGEQERLTDTPEYEASPTWSPDGEWIAFEKYDKSNLEIFLISLANLAEAPIQLTHDPGIDRSPAWSPQGREIAFVSSRSGNDDVWLARLDNIDNRFFNLSQSSQANDRFPVWSSDGKLLTWSSEREGDRKLLVWDKNMPDQPAREIGEGVQVAWSPDNAVVFSEVLAPHGNNLTAYSIETGRLSLPLFQLPGKLYGMQWVKGPLFGWLADQVEDPQPYSQATLWNPILTRTVAPAGRMGLVPLDDVSAPQALLHDAVDEAFTALRQEIAIEAGWDALSSLENAFVALTTPPVPSIKNDWLYTGRAFAINPLLTSAGWVVISKEEFTGQVYWRVYLKARHQDGQMGMPLTDMVWDINARYNGDPNAYEEGGQSATPPAGYWIDLTELASRFGWQRQPSWINWRTFYPSIRFNQFVMTGGLDWNQAMAEVYPPEALYTSTSVPTITPTASQTPRPTAVLATSTPTQTLTPTPSSTATIDSLER